eukprot:m.5380 g.5380  ORF g.5380 m.5380 type:complete len:247 (+) comp4215_c0_seq1:109-849(+)
MQTILREAFAPLFLFKDDAEGDKFVEDVLLSVVILWLPTLVFFIFYKRDTPKRLARGRAWFPTVIVAAVSTYTSIPSVVDTLQNGFSVENMYVDTDRARFGLTFYLVFAITDIVLGLIFYPGEFDLLSGWVHHILYILLQANLLRNHASAIFNAPFLEELPTFILGLGHIHPSFRMDLLFGATFFLTRIAFQFWYSYFIITNYSYDHPSTIFCVVAASIIPILHTYWFIGWLKNIKKYLGIEKKEE